MEISSICHQLQTCQIHGTNSSAVLKIKLSEWSLWKFCFKLCLRILQWGWLQDYNLPNILRANRASRNSNACRSLRLGSLPRRKISSTDLTHSSWIRLGNAGANTFIVWNEIKAPWPFVFVRVTLQYSTSTNSSINSLEAPGLDFCPFNKPSVDHPATTCSCSDRSLRIFLSLLRAASERGRTHHFMALLASSLQ